MSRLMQGRGSTGWIWVLGVALILLVYWETLRPLLSVWTDYRRQLDTYGLFAVGAAAWIAAREWHRAGGARALAPSYVGAASILALSSLWFLAGLVHVGVLQLISVALMLIVLPRALFGSWISPHMVWASLLLVLAVPMWGALGSVLQYMTAVASTELLRGADLLAAREGYTIFVPAGTFQVDSSCSGLSQVLATLVIGALFAYSAGLSRRYAWLFLAVAGLAAALGNVLRVCTVVWIGNATQMQSPVVKEHGWVGLVYFAIILAILLVAAARLPLEKPPPSSHPAQGRAPAGTGASVRLTAILAALVTGPVLAALAPVAQLTAPAIVLPDALGRWQSVQTAPDDAWRPQFRGADSEVQAAFARDDADAVRIYVGRYLRQSQGAEAVSDENRVADPHVWRTFAVGDVEVPELGGTGLRVSEYRLRSQGEEAVVWRWYFVGGTVAGNGYSAKALNLWYTLRGDASVFAVVTQTAVSGSLEQARARLHRFAAEAWPALEMELRGGSQSRDAIAGS